MAADRRAWFWAWAALLIPLASFGWPGLFDIDEGFYASIAAEMRRGGNWWIPTYLGQPWFEKPILVYWLTGASTWLFGEQWGPRLPSALSAIGTAGWCAWYVRGAAGSVAARAAVAMLGGTLLFVLVGIHLLADMPMVFGLTGALALYWRSLDSGSWAGRVGSAALLGWAMLAKGPMAPALFAATVAWTAIEEPALRPRLRAGWPAFAAVFAATAAIWYIPAWLQNPKDFFEMFVLKQNVYRLLGGDDAHRAPLWLYVPFYIIVLAVAAAPWSWLGFAAGWKARRSNLHIATDMRFLWRWMWVVLILFTLSGSKLPHYILPAVPPLVMMAAIGYGERPRWPLALSAGLVAAIAWVAPITYYRASGQEDAHRMARIARWKGKPLATYRLRARDRAVGLRAEAQDTTLPSLGFYLDAPVADLQEIADLSGLAPGSYVLTRRGRMTSSEVAAAGLKRVHIHTVTDRFELYERIGAP